MQGRVATGQGGSDSHRAKELESSFLLSRITERSDSLSRQVPGLGVAAALTWTELDRDLKSRQGQSFKDQVFALFRTQHKHHKSRLGPCSPPDIPRNKISATSGTQVQNKLPALTPRAHSNPASLRLEETIQRR